MKINKNEEEEEVAKLEEEVDLCFYERIFSNYDILSLSYVSSSVAVHSMSTTE